MIMVLKRKKGLGMIRNLSMEGIYTLRIEHIILNHEYQKNISHSNICNSSLLGVVNIHNN